ncbi:hypothetical protein [Spirosoma foliorum]|uniref:Uncharacterized protein n=1 Tax=Spirosoma foliorum TaxID=2710596 RepID=A0A7G5H2R6_9BACT|nr:hypothetical protein [Spirosoma foliorum]QMW05408.1 hypothetical protein H3H32_11200 [Spirosoma foliorum]
MLMVGDVAMLIVKSSLAGTMLSGDLGDGLAAILLFETGTPEPSPQSAIQ